MTDESACTRSSVPVSRADERRQCCLLATQHCTRVVLLTLPRKISQRVRCYSVCCSLPPAAMLVLHRQAGWSCRWVAPAALRLLGGVPRCCIVHAHTGEQECAGWHPPIVGRSSFFGVGEELPHASQHGSRWPQSLRAAALSLLHVLAQHP